MLLYLAIIIYISSLVVALVLTFALKNISTGFITRVGVIHAICFIVFSLLIFSSTKNSERQTSVSILFLISFCTGVSLSGLALRSKASLILKIYFGFFDTSLLLFLVSPSTLFQFLLNGNFTNTNSKLILVKENYFLEQQTSIASGSENNLQYKLIRKNGLFHQTVTRNLDFKGKLDSLKIISFDENVSAKIRGYTNKNTYVETKIDSADIFINLNPKKKDVIERRL